MRNREDPTKFQSLGEEIANSITHGIGVAISVAILVLLVVFTAKRGDTWRIVSFSIFGSSLFILYMASTLYHSFPQKGVKHFFRIMDHSSIYILIAGSYTPITLISMRGAWGWTIFGLVWGLAILGIIFTVFLIGRFKIISTAIYLFMGWLILIAIKPMILMVPRGMIIWLFIGGAFYTLGIIFYLWKKMPYHHMIWHIFVLAGSISHFFGMLFYLT
jgi:hemolysin III